MGMESNIIGLITARGGSKSIPGKNIKPLAGKPLIAWTVEAALQSKGLDRVMVSTDDEKIAQTARQWGAEVPFLRPGELAGDASPHILAVQHALEWLQDHEGERPEYIMLLQPTSPLRATQDIDAVIELAKEKNADAVVSVCESKNHPYTTYRLTENGMLEVYVSSDIGYLRRQDLPPAYVLNGAIYLNRCDSLLGAITFVPEGAYPYIMPLERSMDIDTLWDFALVEFVIQNKGNVIS